MNFNFDIFFLSPTPMVLQNVSKFFLSNSNPWFEEGGKQILRRFLCLFWFVQYNFKLFILVIKEKNPNNANCTVLKTIHYKSNDETTFEHDSCIAIWLLFWISWDFHLHRFNILWITTMFFSSLQKPMKLKVLI